MTTLRRTFDMCGYEIAERIETDNIGMAIFADTDVCGVTLISTPWDDYKDGMDVSKKIIPCGINQDGECVVVLATTEVFDPSRDFLGQPWRFEEEIEGSYWVYETRDAGFGMTRPLELNGRYDVYSNHGIVVFWLK